MKWLSTLLVVLLPLVAQAQTMLSIRPQPTQNEVAKAKGTLDLANAKSVKLKVGGYALAGLEYTEKLKVYVVPGSDDCVKQAFMPKGSTYEGFLRPENASKLEWVEVKPDAAKDRYRITAINPGTATVIWFATVNGEADVITGYKFIIEDDGTQPEPDKPPPVIEPELTKSLRSAYQLDKVAGIGIAADLDKLASVYLALSNDDLSAISTHAQLTEFMSKSVKGAGLPEYTKCLTSTRKRIQQELLNRQSISDESANDSKPINKTLVKAILKDIATSLDAINP